MFILYNITYAYIIYGIICPQAIQSKALNAPGRAGQKYFAMQNTHALMLHHKLQMLILSAFAGIYPTQNERARFAVGLWYNNLTRYRNQRFRTGPESIESLSRLACQAGHAVCDGT